MSTKRKLNFSPKNKRRLIIVNDNWLKNEKYKEWIRKVNDYTLRCVFCNIEFTIKFEGISAITKHEETGNHKKNCDVVKMNSAMSMFVRSVNNKDEEKISIAELCLTYHGLNHHHSYLSSECGIKLSQQVFSDSAICKKVHCARTKLSSIVENILYPKSVALHLSKLGDKRFSISTDASNKGNIKLYPIAIQYFTKEKGITNFVLNFYEDPNETSFAIYKNLKESLEKNNLQIKNIIAFGADNASVNYGINKSVYVNLKNENDLILKANCNCHIVHNTAKYCLMKISLDIENLVTKIFSHFSHSAKRINALKSCYEFVKYEYSEIVKYIPTRWLSLYPALERIINNMEAIKSYFIGIGPKECDNIITEFIWDQNDSDREFTFYELFIHFAHQFMQVFHETVLILENKSTNATDLYNIMDGLRGKIKNRIEYKFFGSKVTQKLHLFSDKERKSFENSALNAYERAIEYLEKSFDFQNSIFKSLLVLNLVNKLEYENVLKLENIFRLKINGDQLFQECCDVNKILEDLNKQQDIKCVEKWCKFFSILNLPNLLKIVETVMAIPIGNDFVERLFSIMRNTWTDERNRLGITMLRAEICTKVNFEMTCLEFNKYVITDKELIKSTKSSKKYTFINQNNN
jgi:hypothetical protein